MEAYKDMGVRVPMSFFNTPQTITIGLMIKTSEETCACCSDKFTEYTLNLDEYNISNTERGGLQLHLNEDELLDLYFQLKEIKCHA